MQKPRLAVTLGDPAGVGPEIVARAWRDPSVHAAARLTAVGHPDVMRRAIRLTGGGLRVVRIEHPADSTDDASTVPCIAAGPRDADRVEYGQIDPVGGRAAYENVVAAAELAIRRDVDGLVTAPLCKSAMWQAGFRYPGHTELLAERCGSDDFAMMLYLPASAGSAARGLGVVHVTLHVAMKDIFSRLTPQAVLAKVRLADGIMRRLSNVVPRIGVAALNPHAGEEGLFGDEEARIILPAVEEAQTEGIDVEGPAPADTLMIRARNGEFDGIVAMYHDQGHIALKLMGMHRAVNITLGLPIVRTSVAHGTAFDIAGSGEARAESMIEAMLVAARLAAAKSHQVSTAPRSVTGPA